MRKARLRIIDIIGSVTCDNTIMITNNPLVMHPNLSFKIQKFYSHSLIHSTSEEMLPGVWTMDGIAGTKYSSTYFHCHLFCHT